MKHYEEPSMRVIRLRNDDVVATDCTLTQSGATGENCGEPGHGTFPPSDPTGVTPGVTL